MEVILMNKDNKTFQIQENNGLLTLITNGFPPKQDLFLQRAFKINRDYNRGFTHDDFAMSAGNARQYISKLKEYLEIQIVSRPNFYKIKGMPMTGDSHRITQKPTGGDDFLDLVTMLTNEPLMMHDMKMKIYNSSVYESLVKNGTSVNSHNKCILINFESADNNITSKILVYPKTIQIDIGCSFKPLVYDMQGFFALFEHLSKISYHISGLSKVLLPPVYEWIITHQHLNKDGSVELNGPKFHLSVNEVFCGFMRFYSKDLPVGTTIRAEKVVCPQTPLGQTIIKVLNN